MVDEELYVAAEALLVQGLPGTVSRELDDENRIIPLAFDIDQDTAVTAFLCWLLDDEGPMPGLEMVTAFRHQGAWVAAGSSACSFPEYPLRDRRPAPQPGRHLSLCLHSSEHHAWRRRPERRYAVLRVTAEVDRIAVGARVLDVPFHGFVTVTARTRRTSVVTALGRDGSALQTLDISRDPLKVFTEQDRGVSDGRPAR
jgi:hypothetical protein